MDDPTWEEGMIELADLRRKAGNMLKLIERAVDSLTHDQSAEPGLRVRLHDWTTYHLALHREIEALTRQLQLCLHW